MRYLLILLLLISGCSSADNTECPERKNKGEDRVVMDFSEGNLDSWGHHFEGDEAAVVVEDPEDSENKVVRFQLREGETYTTRSGPHYRSEIYETYKAPFDRDMRYSFRIYISSEWERDDVRALIAQWHATPDLHLGEASRSPNLGIEYRDDRFLIRMNTSEVRVNKDNRTGIDRRTLYLSEPLEEDRWYDFVVEVKWTYREEGYFRIWIDGDKVVEYSGGTSYNDCTGPYFKMGIYRDDTPKTFVIYHDDYRREILEPKDGNKK